MFWYFIFMRKSLKVFNIIVSIVAIIAVTFTVISLFTQLINVIQNIKGPVEPTGIIFNLLPAIIAIPFAIAEFKNGISILKLTKEDNVVDSLKPVLGLVNSIIGVLLAPILSNVAWLIYDAVTKKTSFDIATIIPLIFGLFMLIMSAIMTRFLKKNAYGGLAIFGLIYVILGFIFIPFTSMLKTTNGLEIGGEICNLVVMILIFVYAIIAICFYNKFKDDIDKYQVTNSDYEVLKELPNNKERIKVYQVRGAKDSKKTSALLYLGLSFYLTFIVLAIVYFFTNPFTINFANLQLSDLFTSFELVGQLSLVFSIPYVIILFVAIKNKNSSYYINILLLMSQISYFAVCGMSVYFSNVSKLVNSTTAIDPNVPPFLKYILGLGPVILMIASLIPLFIARQHFDKVKDSLNNGETFLSCHYHNKAYVICYFISNLLMVTFYLWCKSVDNGVFNYSIIPYFLFLLFFLIAICNYKKNNLEESFITVRNKLTKEEKTPLKPPQKQNNTKIIQK